MDLAKFSAFPESAQNPFEWRTFIEFAHGYFKNRGIISPLVVEIGALHNEQRPFYREFLNAEHYTIDINPDVSPTICGDSADVETLEILKTKVLCGRMIDLLYIDGDHTYAHAKSDYEMYEPLVRHITAIHDCLHISDVARLWREIQAKHLLGIKKTFITIGSPETMLVDQLLTAAEEAIEHLLPDMEIVDSALQIEENHSFGTGLVIKD